MKAKFKKNQLVIFGVFILAGLFLLGFMIGRGLKMFNSGERTVTVKGLAEKEVMADNIFWPIAYTVSDNELGDLNEKIENNKRIIVEFLLSHGFSHNEISFSSPNVIDVQTQLYNSGQTYSFRYLAKGIIKLNTTKLDKVLKASDNSTSLLLKGIVMNSDEYQNIISYDFKGLNEIKPGMIEAANINAKKAAEQFAKDSHSKLGNIKNATQGLFSIEDANFNTPQIKVVRVVTTVQYYLE